MSTERSEPDPRHARKGTDEQKRAAHPDRMISANPENPENHENLKNLENLENPVTTIVAVTEAYPAARSAAPRIHAHFVRHIDAARERGLSPTAVVPPVDALEAILNAAFWASLRRVEGYIPKISLALVSPTQAPASLLFERPLALGPAALAHVAPAVERAGIHLAVWPGGDGLAVWGTTRSIPTYCLVVEVAEPGLIVVKHRRGSEDSGKFANVAVLEGDEVKLIEEDASSLRDCPAILAAMLDPGDPDDRPSAVNVPVQIAVSMRAHRRGGTLLIVPSGSDGWLESVVRPMAYAASPPFSELADLMTAGPGEHPHLWYESVGRAVDTVAGLTAVDGATVMTDGYELLAFGAKLARREGASQVEQVVATEPVEGYAATEVHPTLLGGTRHLSAAQFVHDQPSTVALVASQDGRFTIFAWSAYEQMVHAHRVEALLL
jgi:hypothetical protein